MRHSLFAEKSAALQAVGDVTQASVPCHPNVPDCAGINQPMTASTLIQATALRD